MNKIDIFKKWYDEQQGRRVDEAMEDFAEKLDSIIYFLLTDDNIAVHLTSDDPILRQLAEIKYKSRKTKREL